MVTFANMFNPFIQHFHTFPSNQHWGESFQRFPAQAEKNNNKRTHLTPFKTLVNVPFFLLLCVCPGPCSSLGPSRWCWSPRRCPLPAEGRLKGPPVWGRSRSFRPLCCCCSPHNLLGQRGRGQRREKGWALTTTSLACRLSASFPQL